MLGGPQVTITPATNAHDVDPVTDVVVKANAGTLTDVHMVNDNGKPIDGVMTPDNTVWKPTVPLGYGRTYTLKVSSHGPNGVDSTQVSSFSTLQPSNQTKVSFTTTSEAALKDGGTYGVGTVLVAHFDEQIADRAAAEKQLAVTTNPAVQGSWFWVDDQNAHWRPEHYYTPGTTVNAEAKIYGISLGNGLFGQEDSKVSFRIGDSHVSIADDATKVVQRLRQREPGPFHADIYGNGWHGKRWGAEYIAVDAVGHLHRARQGQPGGDGLLDIRAAQEFAPRVSRDHQLRDKNQYRRHLPT